MRLLRTDWASRPWLFRVLYDLLRILRERNAVRLSVEKFGYARLRRGDILFLTGKPQATRLFILGTGASVEDLTTENFNLMGDSLSVGMNTWPLHWFVPDLYGLEDYEAVQFESGARIISKALEREEVSKRSPLVLYLRSHSQSSERQHISVPEPLARRTYSYGRITVAAKSAAHIRRELRTLVTWGMKGLMPADITIDTGASIVRMVSLGIFLGMRQIVLVGVDLNSTEYFFERNPEHLARNGIASFDTRQSGPAHDTMSTEDRRFNVSDFLRELVSVSRDLGGPEIFVASNTSLLADFLPVFTWD